MVKFRKAFTLAEVLITLAVIGVLAAFTIPSIVENGQKQGYVAALKVFFVEFTGALKQYAQSKGCVNDLACTGAFQKNQGSSANGVFLFNELKENLNITKICGWGYNSNKCNSADGHKTLDGARVDSNNRGDTTYFVTESGAVFWFLIQDNVCTAQIFSDDPNERNCGNLTVDINGPKPPNQTGRDLFNFSITNSASLYPYGGQRALNGGAYRWNCTSGCDNNFTCLSDSINKGASCAGRVMEEGWQMTY